MSIRETLHTLAQFVSYAERLREAGFTEGFFNVMVYVAKVLTQLGKEIDEEYTLPF